MIDKPAFKSCFQVEILDPDGVILLSEKDPILLSGERYCRIARLLNGNNSADQIVDGVGGGVPPAEAYYALIMLEKKGYIVESDRQSIPSTRAAFWDMLDVDPHLAESRLAQTTVSVIEIGSAQVREPLESALASLSIRASDKDANFSVVIADDYLHSDLRLLNDAAILSSHPWLLVKPTGTVLWIGPLFRPGRTACWECLAHRLDLNRQVESMIHLRQGTTAPLPLSHASIPTCVDAALHLAATETAKAIAQGWLETSESKIVTLNTLTLETQKHCVVRRPQCGRCGSPLPPHAGEPFPAEPLPQRPALWTDSGQRTLSPDRTFAQFEHHVSPVTGAVSHLQRVSAVGDPYIHVYESSYNPAVKRGRDLEFLRKGLRANSGGKGTTDIQAKTSALCEALERFSGVFQGDETRRRCTFRQLGASALDPNECMLFSQQQYEDRAEWNMKCSPVQSVPEPFDENTEIDWSPVWSLTRRTWRHLPTSYCYYDYPLSQGMTFAHADSNGNASGNTLQEAILQGLLELVERDSVSLWWYCRNQRPAVDLDSFDEPYVQALRKHYANVLSRELWMIDLTTDLRIPCFAAISRRIGQSEEQVLFGFGAHLDPRIGVLRALTELNQFLVCVMSSPFQSRDRNGIAIHIDPALDHWLTNATLSEHPYLLPSNGSRVRSTDFDAPYTDDLGENLRHIQATVERLGMEVLVLEQTRPDIGLPVAKVFVPGLRHFWARFAPGRLYDIPVELGWRREPPAETQLNPFPMFL